MKKCVLIVEDESSIADTITWTLNSEGFECRWVTTGQAALALAKETPIHLAVLDVGLPDIQGFELYKRLQLIKPMPVIFLTARNDEIDRVVGLEIGADDYITKPFSPRELCARVKAVLRRAHPHADSPALHSETRSFGPFTIDYARMRASYYTSELELSKTEFRLLAALVERPGRVLSREQLMGLAWDAPESALDRTVDAHVKSLRAKLNAVRSDESAIITHRGLGYALREKW